MGFSRGRDHGQILPALGAHGRQRGMQSQNFWEKYQDRGGQYQFEVLYMLAGAVASGGDGSSGRNIVEVEAGIEVEL